MKTVIQAKEDKTYTGGRRRPSKLSALNVLGPISQVQEVLPPLEVHQYSEELQEIMNFELEDLNIDFPPKISTQTNNLLIYGYGVNTSIGT